MFLWVNSLSSGRFNICHKQWHDCKLRSKMQQDEVKIKKLMLTSTHPCTYKLELPPIMCLTAILQTGPLAWWDARPPGSILQSCKTFFCGDWSWNHSSGHSLPIADSSKAVVSYWQKDVHQVLVNCLGLSLPRKSVVRLTDHLVMTIVVDWDVKPLNKHTNKQYCSIWLNSYTFLIRCWWEFSCHTVQ